jgi:hypothetical protein
LGNGLKATLEPRCKKVSEKGNIPARMKNLDSTQGTLTYDYQTTVSSILNYTPIMASPSDLTALVNKNITRGPDIIEPYFQKALSSSRTPVSIFNQASSPGSHTTAPEIVATT